MCLENDDHSSYSDYRKGIDLDGTVSGNCDCNYFQYGAAGCIRNGQSQCCYSALGALLVDPSEGGGTRKCSNGDFMTYFLHDILPYVYCCKLNDSCESYYAARQSLSDAN